MSDGGYPRRLPYFAFRAVRLAMKACLAQNEGPVAFAIFVCVAMTEDAKRYSGPVTWFDATLAPIVGANSVRALAWARDKLVHSGWLAYQHGGKSRPGRYWVTIPEWIGDVNDSPADESDLRDLSATNGPAAPLTDETGSGDPAREEERVSVIETKDKREQNVSHTQDKREQSVSNTQSKREHFIPVPDPLPSPLPKKDRDAEASVSLGETSRFVPPTEDEVAEYCEKHELRFVDQVAWFSYYASVGWKVGKKPMRSWPHALRSWNHRGKGNDATRARRNGGFRGDFLADFATEEVAT